MKSMSEGIYRLEHYSNENTFVQKLHPTVKLLTTFVFVFAVVSFGRYSFFTLLPLFFYPTLLAALANIPYMLLFRRFLAALPFVFFAALSVLFFTEGNSSKINPFLTIILKSYLTVFSVLILAGTTPFFELINTMRRMKIPPVMITIFEMTYRYIGVLSEEARTMYTAYSLRGNTKKGIKINDMGSFIGHLLLSGFERAERVYNAMKCRGYLQLSGNSRRKGLNYKDILYLILVNTYIISIRIFDFIL